MIHRNIDDVHGGAGPQFTVLGHSHAERQVT